ncbi:SCAN box domain-containing protein [Trichonephila clavipes]|nr:SCAN box domain-containing protein [Trichonephila clavipes]
MFERQMKLLNVPADFWVSHLIGVLPNDIGRLIAREPEEMFRNYAHIHNILLKRFKLTADRFRSPFADTQKQDDSTWKRTASMSQESRTVERTLRQKRKKQLDCLENPNKGSRLRQLGSNGRVARDESLSTASPVVGLNAKQGKEELSEVQKRNNFWLSGKGWKHFPQRLSLWTVRCVTVVKSYTVYGQNGTVENRVTWRNLVYHGPQRSLLASGFCRSRAHGSCTAPALTAVHQQRGLEFSHTGTATGHPSEEVDRGGKGPLTPARLLKLVKRFEETGKLEDRARAGRPCLKKKNVHPALLSKWKRLRPKHLPGPAVLVKLPDDWAYHHHLFTQYSSSNLPAVPVQIAIVPAVPHRGAFAKWIFSKMEQDPTWVFNILWTDEARFSLHGDVNNHNCRIWATSNPRSTHRSIALLKSDSMVWFHGFIYHRTLPSLKRSSQ